MTTLFISTVFFLHFNFTAHLLLTANTVDRRYSRQRINGPYNGHRLLLGSNGDDVGDVMETVMVSGRTLILRDQRTRRGVEETLLLVDQLGRCHREDDPRRVLSSLSTVDRALQRTSPHERLHYIKKSAANSARICRRYIKER